MKSGSTTTIPNGDSHGLSPANHQHQRRSQISMDPSLCSAFGVIYYELLKPNEMITGECYRTQLIRLNHTLKEKRSEYGDRHDKAILQHDNARPHVAKPVKIYLKTLKWEVPPAVFSRCCSLWLSLVSINGTRPGWPALPVLWRSKKLDRFVDSLKRWPVFSTRDSYATRKMGESSGQRWTILWIINV